MTEPTPEQDRPAAPDPSVAQARPAAPTPAAVNGDVPVETWRRSLEQIAEAPALERHELQSTLLDDLDSQVSSL